MTSPPTLDQATKNRIFQSEQFLVLRIIAEYAQKHPQGVTAISIWSYAFESYRDQLPNRRFVFPLGDTLAALKQMHYIEDCGIGYRVTIHGTQVLARPADRRALRNTQENPPVPESAASSGSKVVGTFGKTVVNTASSVDNQDTVVQLGKPSFPENQKTIIGIGSMGALKPTNQGRRLRVNTNRK